MIDYSGLKRQDPELYAGIKGELERLGDNIELIASENVVSENVLLAAGSVLKAIPLTDITAVANTLTW